MSFFGVATMIGFCSTIGSETFTASFVFDGKNRISYGVSSRILFRASHGASSKTAKDQGG